MMATAYEHDILAFMTDNLVRRACSLYPWLCKDADSLRPFSPVLSQSFAKGVEKMLNEFVEATTKQTAMLPPMKWSQRKFAHELAEKYNLRSESLDEEPNRRYHALARNFMWELGPHDIEL
jgi:R3H domain